MSEIEELEEEFGDFVPEIINGGKYLATPSLKALLKSNQTNAALKSKLNTEKKP